MMEHCILKSMKLPKAYGLRNQNGRHYQSSWYHDQTVSKYPLLKSSKIANEIMFLV